MRGIVGAAPLAATAPNSQHERAGGTLRALDDRQTLILGLGASEQTLLTLHLRNHQHLVRDHWLKDQQTLIDRAKLINAEVGVGVTFTAVVTAARARKRQFTDHLAHSLIADPTAVEQGGAGQVEELAVEAWDAERRRRERSSRCGKARTQQRKKCTQTLNVIGLSVVVRMQRLLSHRPQMLQAIGIAVDRRRAER